MFRFHTPSLAQRRHILYETPVYSSCFLQLARLSSRKIPERTKSKKKKEKAVETTDAWGSRSENRDETTTTIRDAWGQNRARFVAVALSMQLLQSRLVLLANSSARQLALGPANCFYDPSAPSLLLFALTPLNLSPLSRRIRTSTTIHGTAARAFTLALFFGHTLIKESDSSADSIVGWWRTHYARELDITRLSPFLFLEMAEIVVEEQEEPWRSFDVTSVSLTNRPGTLWRQRSVWLPLNF